MPQQKKQIIDLWLNHSSYRQIEAKTGIAASAAHRVVEDWRRDLDASTAEALRQFMAEVKKSKVKKLSELAHAYRIHNLAKSMNISDIEIESFLSELNNECVRRNIEPSKIARLLEQVVEFSSKQKVSLDEASGRIKKLGKELADIREETDAAKDARDKALRDKKVTTDNLDEYMRLRSNLKDSGLPPNEPQKLKDTSECESIGP